MEFFACYDIKSFSDLLLQMNVPHSEGISSICPSYTQHFESNITLHACHIYHAADTARKNFSIHVM